MDEIFENNDWKDSKANIDLRNQFRNLNEQLSAKEENIEMATIL